MKKRLLIVLSIILMVTAPLVGCTKNQTTIPAYEDGIKDACFKMGGLLNQKDECVLPEPTPVIQTVEVEKVVEVPVIQTVEVEKVVEVPVLVTPTPEKEVDPRCPYTIELGSAGEFFSYWDPGFGSCVIDMAEEHRVTAGMPLWQIKQDGLEYTLTMPFRGMLNHSAEFVFLNDQECIPGNPVNCQGQTVFDKNTVFTIKTLAGNKSAGSFIIQVQP